LLNVESVAPDLLHGWEFLRWRLDEVHDLLIDAEVHEFDPQLVLNLFLFLDSPLKHNAHFINGIVLSLVCNIDPILELSVDSDCLSP
jgi:hypothetical protein